MGHRSHLQSEVLLDSVSSTGDDGRSEPMNVKDFRHVGLSVGTSGSATMTVQVKASIEDEAPDFSSAAGEDNQWDYVQTINLNDDGSNNGDDGIAYSGTDAVELLEINTNLITHFVVEVTSYTAGTVTVIANATGN